MDCVNVDEFISRLKKDISKIIIHCEGCKKNVKFKIKRDDPSTNDYYYICDECNGESDLEVTNDILL